MTLSLVPSARVEGTVTDALLTLSDRHSTLSGRLEAVTGQPASDYFVIVYSADRDHWRPGARRVKATRPANDGAWSARDLPAGDYLVAVLTDVEPDEWEDANFLAQLASVSVPVHVADGASVTQNLRIAQ